MGAEAGRQSKYAEVFRHGTGRLSKYHGLAGAGVQRYSDAELGSYVEDAARASFVAGLPAASAACQRAETIRATRPVSP